MNKNILSVSIVITGLLVAGVIAGSAVAQTETQVTPEISYPVVELGNCADMAACKIYCDKLANMDACLSFAEKNNLMTKEEIAAAKNFKNAGMTGPSGCKGKDECDTYCSNPDHMDECITFAEKNGLMSAKQLEEAKKVKAAITKGIKPPACSGSDACDAYCSAPEYMEECINFSIEAGIMDPQKQEEAKKVLAAIKKGIKPPPCKGQTECDAYCSSSEHMEECMNFAIEAGMMSGQEKERAQKSLEAIKQGIKPPACKGEKECQTYCSEENHIEECIKFGEATGMIKKEDAEMIRKTGGKGPGGCKGKEECDAYCNNSDNQETCFQFGKENGMIPKEDLKKMEEGQTYCASNPEECKNAGGLGGGGTVPGPGGGGPGGGGPNEGQGFNPGSGQGGGQGQSVNPNPVKCIEDCELVGRNCISALGAETKVCISKGEYCRQVTCETVDAEGNRSTAEVMRQCYASKCDPLEASCHDAVTTKDSACRTTKDVCVMNCQKASKSGGPGPGVQGGPGGTGPGSGIGPGPSGPGSGTGPGTGDKGGLPPGGGGPGGGGGSGGGGGGGGGR